MKFELKRWKDKYLYDLQKYADNPNIARWLRDAFPTPYTIEDAVTYIDGRLSADDSAELCRAIVVDGEAVGSVGVFVGTDVYRRSAELGYWLAEKYWRCGIMSEAVRMICREAFDKFDIVRIYAEPYADNVASRRVLNNAGFRLEGTMERGVYKNGEMHDYCMYALLKE